MSDVSVVVPFYNRSSFLERLLDSVFNQTKEPSKVYLVDNGSCDSEVSELLFIINKDKFKGIDIVYTSTANKGNANYARNLGYILSDTEYVAFLDSDDWWDPDHLRVSINKLISSDFVAVYSGAKVLKNKKINKKYSVDVNNYRTPFELFFSSEGYLAQTSSYIVNKKSIGFDVLWDENLKRHQDYDYFSSIFYETKGWCYCPEVNVNIDWDEGGTKKKDIDFASLTYFCDKWQSKIPNNILKPYLITMLRLSYEYKTSLEIKDYYRSVMDSNNYFSDRNYKIKSNTLLIYTYSYTIKTLEILEIKNIIKNILKKFK